MTKLTSTQPKNFNQLNVVNFEVSFSRLPHVEYFCQRITIPSSRLRGFESGKIGPKEGTTYIGGNYGSAINLNTTLPNILCGYENIDASLFLDAANLWHVDYNSSLDSNKIRSSTGAMMNWNSPLGPMSFTFSTNLSKASTDVTERFNFQLGTTY